MVCVDQTCGFAANDNQMFTGVSLNISFPPAFQYLMSYLLQLTLVICLKEYAHGTSENLHKAVIELWAELGGCAKYV